VSAYNRRYEIKINGALFARTVVRAGSPEQAMERLAAWLGRVPGRRVELFGEISIGEVGPSTADEANEVQPTLTQRHQAHYRHCPCLDSSAVCCDPTCPSCAPDEVNKP
jgi:hypothetical protein